MPGQYQGFFSLSIARRKSDIIQLSDQNISNVIEYNESADLRI